MKTNALIVAAGAALRSGVICLLAGVVLSSATQAAEPAGRTDAPVETATQAEVDQKVRMNFRGVPLGMVLEYFAEAAGFTIVLETPAKGTVDVWSDRPLSHQEALDLLNSALIKNGLAALRKDRTLTIVQRDEIKTRPVPVKVAAHPGQIPENDEVVTQIIPVRNSTAADLLKDLQPLVSSHAMLTANEAANAIVITDVQTTIHKVAEIIQAVDAGAEDVVTLKVIRLQNCDPVELAALLAQAFPDVNSSQTDQATQFGRPPGMGFGGLGGFGGPPGNQPQTSGNARAKKTDKLTTVADQRTASIVLGGPPQLVAQAEKVVASLDAQAARAQKVRVYRLDNAQPQQALKVLQDLFQRNATTSQSDSVSDPLETRSTRQAQTSPTADGETFGGGGAGIGQGSMSGQGSR